jgi:hypothetical protein
MEEVTVVLLFHLALRGQISDLRSSRISAFSLASSGLRDQASAGPPAGRTIDACSTWPGRAACASMQATSAFLDAGAARLERHDQGELL